MIERICRGDGSAFREFVDTHSQHIYKVAYSVLRDAKAAEDTAQEAFLQIYKSLPNYRFEGLKTWITRIALHKAIDEKRRRDRMKQRLCADESELEFAPSGSEDIPSAVIRRDRNDRLRSEIKRLPEGYREVVTAYYLEHKNYEQIAAEFGITLKSVESRLYRARHWIRNHWKKEEWI
ncbi:RNA polymerase sigma factor [Paenibacillus durus]|uniref:RNA polymerase sigma factor n=1 Tax=Paenibacillus durus TaxID=44251 RepID=UPI001E5290A7|nr:RNA polymerase sigma factor [Paenibacillus durus]